MPHSSADLQTGIVRALQTDAGLVSLLGGPKIFDHAPDRVGFPYLTLGRSAVIDWSTGTEDGDEHVLTLHVWSRGGSKAEAYEIMDKVSTRLQGETLNLESHRLVNLQLQFAEARREPGEPVYHGILRFRAVPEPLAS